jgi:hypothetical protein
MAALTIDRGSAWAPHPRRAALPWLLLAAALHLLLMMALWRLREPVALPDAAVPAVITYLRLLWPPPVHPARPQRPPTPPPAVRVASPQIVAPPTSTGVDAREADPITPPSAAADHRAAADAGTAARAADAPLNLRLPDRAASAPPTIGSQVLDDPRVAHHRSFGERFAQTLGSDTTLHEEQLANNTLRLRRGTTCVVLSEAATTRLDPFSQTYAPTPRPVGRCP